MPPSQTRFTRCNNPSPEFHLPTPTITPKLPTPITTHNTTPSTSGRTPTAAIAFRDSPAPIKNNVTPIAAPATRPVTGTIPLTPGTHVRTTHASTNPPINHGTCNRPRPFSSRSPSKSCELPATPRTRSPHNHAATNPTGTIHNARDNFTAVAVSSAPFPNTLAAPTTLDTS